MRGIEELCSWRFNVQEIRYLRKFAVALSVQGRVLLSGVTLIKLPEKRRPGGLAFKKMFMQPDKKLKAENQSTAEMYQR